MPFYLKEDDRDLARKLQKVCTCAECDSRLEVFYDLDKHVPFLSCKANLEHQGIVRAYKEPIKIINPYKKKIKEEV